MHMLEQQLSLPRRGRTGQHIAPEGEEANEVDKVAEACSGWAHKVAKASDKSKKKREKPALPPQGTTIHINCDADIDQVAKIIERASKGKKGKRPNIQVAEDEFISVVDSGSVVTGAKAARVFPKHKVQESDAQRRGVAYISLRWQAP